jgi:hypothetical protein
MRNGLWARRRGSDAAYDRGDVFEARSAEKLLA